MTVAHATAILPTAPRVLDHAPAADADALRKLGRWATRFTPRVAAALPAGLVLDVAGSARLFGGLVPLARDVRRRLHALRLNARVAVAPTVGLAWGMARFANEGVTDDLDDLFDVPVAALRVEADVIQALAEVGVDRVGQLADIPRDEIARRFGEDVLLRLDQARGEASEPMDWLPFFETPRVEFRFAGPATQYEAIQETARSLTGELCRDLARRESATRRVVLEIEKLDGDLRPAFATLPVTLSHPSRDARHVWAVIRPGVEKLDLGRGVDAMSLVATSVSRLPHGQLRCDGGRDDVRDEHDLGRLVDLLQGRLGREATLRYEPTPGHVPEAAFRTVPASEPRRPGAHGTTDVDGDRPTLLLDRPERAEVMLMNPEGPLVTLTWRGVTRRVLTTVGPERVGRRWWHFAISRRSLAVRDYYKLQDETGLWLWAFRAMPSRRWFVHGLWS